MNDHTERTQFPIDKTDEWESRQDLGATSRPSPAVQGGGENSPTSAVLSASRLAEIEARAERATAGPWRVVTIHHVPPSHPDFGNSGRSHKALYDSDHETEPGGFPVESSDENLVFMAAARSDVPALIAVVEAQAAEIARLTKERNEICNSPALLACSEHWKQRAESAERTLAELREIVSRLAKADVLQVGMAGGEHIEAAWTMARALATNLGEVTPGSSNSKEK